MNRASASNWARSVRRISWMAWMAASLAALVWSMAVLRIDRAATAGAGDRNFTALLPYWIASGSAWAALTVLWFALRRQSGAVRGCRFVGHAVVILLVGAAVRAAVLFTHTPALSEDIDRYVFDGRNLAAGINPYLVIPADRIGAPREHWPGESQVLDRLAYREMATPYLPVSHYVFGAIALCIGDRWSDPDSSERLFRAAFVLLELIMIGLLLVLVEQAGKSPWCVALYAWHPLPITEIAGSGHQDIIGVVLLIGAMLLFTRRPTARWRWPVILALSAMVKPVTLPAIAFMLKNRSWRMWLSAAVALVATAFVIALPLRWMPIAPGKAFTNWRATAGAMAEKWAHFGGVYEPVLFLTRNVMPPPEDDRALGWNLVQETRTRQLCMAGLALTVVCIYFIRRMNIWRVTQATLFAAVLFSTTAHPWYLLWALAFIPLAWNSALWGFSLTICWGYSVLVTGKVTAAGEEWTVSPIVIAAAYVPVFAALIIQSVLNLYKRLPNSDF